MNPSSIRLLSGWYSARALMGAEWAPAVMCALLTGPLHYRDILELLRENAGSDGWPERHQTLHDSILSRTLKRLVEDSLVQRNEERAKFPPSVVYSLSQAGHDLVEAAGSLADWSTQHPDVIARAQVNRTR